MISKSSYENDKPELKNDYLNYRSFAQNIKRALNSLPTDSGFSCALDGVWGIGKTTLINFLKDEINNDERFKYKVIDFSPWNIFDAQNLINEFFALLKSTIEEDNKNARIKKIITQYYQIIIEGVKLIPKVNNLNSFLDIFTEHFKSKNVQTAASLKSELSDYLKYEYEGKDLLVIIDDVDRMTGNEIMILMKLIKEIADFPHITYLLSLDKNNVAKSINHFSNYQEDNKFGYTYLDKFVQLWWTIPVIRNETMLSFLTDKVITLVTKEKFYKEKDYFNKICSNLILKRSNNNTLRKIKLLFNSFRINYESMGNYTNFCDLLAYTWIELFYPDLVTIILANPNLLLKDLRSGNNFVVTSTGKTEEEENIEKNKNLLKNILPVNFYNEYSNILFSLFPLCKYNCSSKVSKPSQENDIMRLLICTKENFYSYFYQKESEFITSYNLIIDCERTGNINYICDILKRNKNNITDFTNYLLLYCKYKYKEINIYYILSALFVFGNTLTDDERHFLIGNILDYIYPPNCKKHTTLYQLVSLIEVIEKNNFLEIDNFLIHFMYSFINQGLLVFYSQDSQDKLLKELSNKICQPRKYNENLKYFIRICYIFNSNHDNNTLKKLFKIKIDFLISYIIVIYYEFNKTQPTLNLSFKTYYAGNSTGPVFDLNNFWNFYNQDLSNIIISNSNGIKSFLNKNKFNKNEESYKKIIETYCGEFNI